MLCGKEFNLIQGEVQLCPLDPWNIMSDRNPPLLGTFGPRRSKSVICNEVLGLYSISFTSGRAGE